MINMQSIKEKILEFLKSGKERSTGEIANYLGISTNKARYHLMRMHLDGLVKLRRASGKVWLWSISESKNNESE